MRIRPASALRTSMKRTIKTSTEVTRAGIPSRDSAIGNSRAEVVAASVNDAANQGCPWR